MTQKPFQKVLAVYEVGFQTDSITILNVSIGLMALILGTILNSVPFSIAGAILFLIAMKIKKVVEHNPVTKGEKK